MVDVFIGAEQTVFANNENTYIVPRQLTRQSDYSCEIKKTIGSILTKQVWDQLGIIPYIEKTIEIGSATVA